MERKKSHKKDEKIAKKELEVLNSEIGTLKIENEELLSKLQRVMADYANYQKRIPKQIAETVSFEKENLVKSVLPALDNFEHVLNNIPKTNSIEDLGKGVKIIYDQMLDMLKSFGIEQIKAVGEEFDPSIHQAMVTKHEADEPDVVVLEEFQAGYKLNGRVIRPSKVVVNKHTSPQEQAQEQTDNEQNGEEEQE